MGPKKNKPDSIIQKQQKPSTVVSNKNRTIKTGDGGIFQINDALLSKFSGKLRKRIDQIKGDEPLEIQDIDKVTFKYIDEFLSNRKDRQMSQIHFPIRSNISLKFIMDESDALLMERIQTQGGMQLVHRLLDAATSLQMQDLRKRLFCLVALQLSKHTIDELKDMYDIPNLQINEEELKSKMKGQLEDLKRNDKKMDEQ